MKRFEEFKLHKDDVEVFSKNRVRLIIGSVEVSDGSANVSFLIVSGTPSTKLSCCCYILSLHCVLAAAQCIVIGPVCLFVAGCVCL